MDVNLLHMCHFNWIERTAKMPRLSYLYCEIMSISPILPPWSFQMFQFSDELSARLANIRNYDHECVKICPRLRDCHETPPDMWHCDITPGWQVLLCPGCGACVHNQVPLSPAQPQVARQNILWEQGSLERGDLTVGVLIKLNSSIWLQLSETLSRDGILCLWCPKETSLKRIYHFCLFQHEIIMFSLTFAVCQQSKSVNFMMRKYI